MYPVCEIFLGVFDLESRVCCPFWLLLTCVSLHRSLLMFTMENCFYLLISQAVRYLRDPTVHPRDKQRMKQELSSELVSSLYHPRSSLKTCLVGEGRLSLAAL